MFHAMRWAWAPIIAVFFLPALASPLGAAGAQDGKALDRTLHNNLKDIINHGAQLFNKQGDHYGCYRVYDGALRAVRPLLDHHPDLQKTIDEGLANAERQPRASDRAFELRRVIDAIRAKVGPAEPPIKDKKDPEKKIIAQPTLWDQLGGEAKIAKIVEDFIIAASDDSRVNVTRNGKIKLEPGDVDKLKRRLIEFLSASTGGPFKYTGKSMKDAHKGMGITHMEFEAAASHFRLAMKKNKVDPAAANAVMKAIAGLRMDIVELPPNHGWVHGTVLWDGKPGPTGYLTFIKEGSKFSTFIYPDGTFNFRNPLPAGEYNVAFAEGLKDDPLTAKNPFRFPKRYTDAATSGLRFTVVAGDNRCELRPSRK